MAFPALFSSFLDICDCTVALSTFTGHILRHRVWDSITGISGDKQSPGWRDVEAGAEQSQGSPGRGTRKRVLDPDGPHAGCSPPGRDPWAWEDSSCPPLTSQLFSLKGHRRDPGEMAHAQRTACGGNKLQ